MAATADNWTSISALADMATGNVNPMFWGIVNFFNALFAPRYKTGSSTYARHTEIRVV